MKQLYSDEKLIEAYNSSRSLEEIARFLGLSNASGNRGKYLRKRIRSLGLSLDNIFELASKKKPINNFQGKKFGTLTVLEYVYFGSINGGKWKCICDCGNIQYSKGYLLNKGKKTTCAKCSLGISSKKCRRGGKYVTGTYWRSLIEGAKLRNINFNISLDYIEDLLVNQTFKCSISGIPLIPPSYTVDDYTASLDRIDSSKDYCEGNVQWIHKVINKMKNNIDQQEFIRFCKLVGDFNDSV